MSIFFALTKSTWFVDMTKFKIGNIILDELTWQQKNKFL